MNPIDRMHVFTRVAELGSFTQTADDFGMPKASISTAVQQLEAQLGTRLLHRTTRKVQLTQDGQAFYERSKDLLADIDEAQTMFQQGGEALRGRVRIDMSTGIARHAVIPRLPELLKLHPLLELELSGTERFVDVVREGFDCVVRGGTVTDAGLVARPVGQMRLVNCASPAYLQARGQPESIDDLATHQLVHFVNILGARSAGFEYLDGPQERRVPMGGAITVNNAEAYTAACLAGLGIIQVPYVAVSDLLAAGDLVELLPRHVPKAMPVTLLYANRRHLARRVRVVMDWLADVLGEYLGSSQLPADARIRLKK
jgi:DNA-binding transcriptional LysR family regulator